MCRGFSHGFPPYLQGDSKYSLISYLILTMLKKKHLILYYYTLKTQKGSFNCEKCIWHTLNSF
jgi:hypothetical protein